MDLDDAEEGGAHHASGEAEIDDANDVDTSADLEHFIEFKTKSDKHIEEIKIKDGKLIVVYAMPVKFFGFWGTTLDTTTEINAEGEAEVSYPWYSIFMKKDFSKKTLEPMFKTAIKSHTMVTSDTTVGATTTAEVSGKKTFSVPHVLEAVITIYGKVSMSDISYTK